MSTSTPSHSELLESAQDATIASQRALDAGDPTTAVAQALVAAARIQEATLLYLQQRDKTWEAKQEEWRQEDLALREEERQAARERDRAAIDYRMDVEKRQFDTAVDKLLPPQVREDGQPGTGAGQ